MHRSIGRSFDMKLYCHRDRISSSFNTQACQKRFISSFILVILVTHQFDCIAHDIIHSSIHQFSFILGIIRSLKRIFKILA